jgi:hypothetical protein
MCLSLYGNWQFVTIYTKFHYFFSTQSLSNSFLRHNFKLYFNIILSILGSGVVLSLQRVEYRMVSPWLEYRHKKEWSLLGDRLTDSGLAQSLLQRVSQFVLGSKVSGEWRLSFLPSIKVKNEQKQRYTWNPHMCSVVLTMKNFTYNFASPSLRQLLKLPYL